MHSVLCGGSPGGTKPLAKNIDSEAEELPQLYPGHLKPPLVEAAAGCLRGLAPPLQGTGRLSGGCASPGPPGWTAPPARERPPSSSKTAGRRERARSRVASATSRGSQVALNMPGALALSSSSPGDMLAPPMVWGADVLLPLEDRPRAARAAFILETLQHGRPCRLELQLPPRHRTLGGRSVSAQEGACLRRSPSQDAAMPARQENARQRACPAHAGASYRPQVRSRKREASPAGRIQSARECAMVTAEVQGHVPLASERLTPSFPSARGLPPVWGSAARLPPPSSATTAPRKTFSPGAPQRWRPSVAAPGPLPRGAEQPAQGRAQPPALLVCAASAIVPSRSWPAPLGAGQP